MKHVVGLVLPPPLSVYSNGESLLPQGIKRLRINELIGENTTRSDFVDTIWTRIKDKFDSKGELIIGNLAPCDIDNHSPNAESIPEDLRERVTHYQLTENDDIKKILRMLPNLKELTMPTFGSATRRTPFSSQSNMKKFNQVKKELAQRGIRINIAKSNSDFDSYFKQGFHCVDAKDLKSSDFDIPA
jgi:hypothetical protein